MENKTYVERIVREFHSRNPEHIDAHNSQLESIFEQVRELSSPQKEERFVELIVSAHWDEPPSVTSPSYRREEPSSNATAPA